MSFRPFNVVVFGVLMRSVSEFPSLRLIKDQAFLMSNLIKKPYDRLHHLKGRPIFIIRQSTFIGFELFLLLIIRLLFVGVRFLDGESFGRAAKLIRAVPPLVFSVSAARPGALSLLIELILRVRAFVAGLAHLYFFDKIIISII